MIDICNTLAGLQGNGKGMEKPLTKEPTQQVKPVEKPQKPQPQTQAPQGRQTSSTGQYKPRRPAPKKPPGRPAPARPTRARRGVETSNEALLSSASLSLESDSSQSEFGSKSTTSLKLQSPAEQGRNLKQERSKSSDALSSGNISKSAMGKENPGFVEHEDVQVRKERKNAGRGTEAMSEGATALVLENEGAEESSLPSGRWEDEEEGNRNSFILEPPADFSQKDSEDEEEEEGLEFMFPEHSTSAVMYDFGPEYGEGIEDSPFVERRNELQSPKPETDTSKQEPEKPNWKKRLSETNNPMWLVDDDQFDTFDRRDALEEDDVPNPVYDDDVSQLLW